MTEKYIMANGLRLAYDEFGEQDKPVIVMVMGLGTQMIAWPEPLCNALADSGYRVIRFDNRDIGLSQKIDVRFPVSIPKLLLRHRFNMRLRVPYTLHDMAQDAIGLLDALNIKSAHWVGASMGGMIAQILAANYPERTLSLTSIMSTTGNKKLPQTSMKVSKQMISRPKNGSEDAYLKHSMQTWAIVGSPGYPPNKEDLTAKILNSLRRSYYPAGYQNQLAAIIECGDRRGLLRKIDTPTLVIHGEEDVLVPVEGGIDTANNITGATLKLISGMGHDLPKELLPRFARYISEHIKASSITHKVKATA